jgi:hypothetical protein
MANIPSTMTEVRIGNTSIVPSHGGIDSNNNVIYNITVIEGGVSGNAIPMLASEYEQFVQEFLDSLL